MPGGEGGGWKIFKIKGPKLAKSSFPEISAWKNLIKNKSARSLALKFGRFKKLSAGFSFKTPSPLATALEGQR